MSTPSAKALSTLRAKHLTALEQITSLTQQLARVTQQNNNTDGITAALKKGQATWDLEKDKLNQALSSLNERLQHSTDKTLALTATNAELQQQANEWKTQCTLIQERINTQKGAFITATDSVALLRNELAEIKTKHQLELQAFAKDSAEDAALLREWRLKAEGLQTKQLATDNNSEALTATVVKLKSEIKRLQDGRKRDNLVVSEQSFKLQQIAAQKMEALHKQITALQHDVAGAKQDNERLKRTHSNNGQELRNAQKEIKELKNQVLEGTNKHVFLNKALVQAKSEWNLLSQENARLKVRLDQLNALNGKSSKFAKFVAIKEENLKLSNENSRLIKNSKKINRHLRGQNRQNGKYRKGAPGIPRRPETNAT